MDDAIGVDPHRQTVGLREADQYEGGEHAPADGAAYKDEWTDVQWAQVGERRRRKNIANITIGSSADELVQPQPLG